MSTLRGSGQYPVDKCRGQDLNLHALRHQILSLARLPISPPRRIFILLYMKNLSMRSNFLLRFVQGFVQVYRRDER